MDFAGLLSPFPAEKFMAEHWEHRPLTVRHDDPGRFRELLSLADADYVLSNASLRSGELRVVNDGCETTPSDLEGLYSAYREGSTVVLVGLHRRWPPLRRLSRALNADLSADIQVNAYLTPPGSRGFSLHYDTHDVFVLQVCGRKHWRLFHDPIRLPLARQPFSANRSTVTGDPIEEPILAAGDLIYIPRGFLHEATSLDTTSLHLTVGIHPVTWGAVIAAAIDAATDDDPELRAGLPPGFTNDAELERQSVARMHELLSGLWRRMSAETLVTQARADALLRRPPSLDGHLLDLEAERALRIDTRLRWRGDLTSSLATDATHITLRSAAKSVRMPGFVESDVRFMQQAPDFAADELPGELDADGRLVLVRRLLFEGFLTVCSLDGDGVARG